MWGSLHFIRIKRSFNRRRCTLLRRHEAAVRLCCLVKALCSICTSLLHGKAAMQLHVSAAWKSRHAAAARLCCMVKAPLNLLWPGASQLRIYYQRMWGQLSTTCSNLLKKPNGELLVAEEHYQLRTMASETVDPIDWSHPPPSCTVPPERHVQSINRCSLSSTGNRSCCVAWEATLHVCAAW